MAGQGVNLLTLKPAGPVAHAWEFDQADVSAIIGPVGSGKTTADIKKIIREACAQHRSPADGKRRLRHCVFGATATALSTNFLESWFEWFPPTLGKYVGMPEFEHEFEFNDGEGPVVMTMLMRPVDEHSLERQTRGLQITSACLFEADLLPMKALGAIHGRTGRFPGNASPHGKPARMRVWMELNMPDEDSVWYDYLLGSGKPDSVNVYVQPGGREAEAENRQNLPEGYYARQMETRDAVDARRMVDNLPTISRAGMPVHPEFNDRLHTARYEIEPLDRPLSFGLDQGLHAAFVLSQEDEGGQKRFLDEVVAPGAGEDVYEFSERVRALLAQRYRGLPVLPGTADPAAFARSATQQEAQSWGLMFGKITGLRVRPARSNAPSLRQAALRHRLTTMVDGQRPGLLLSSRCTGLRRALASGYRRKQRNQTGSYYDQIEKNEHSHVAEAAEYDCLGSDGMEDALTRRTGTAGHAPRPVVAPHDFAVV